MNFQFNEIIFNLGNEKVIEAWADGLKTYTNAKFHIDYSANFHWFEGMNYPYGEHIMPATELPGIAIFLKALKPLFPNISEAVVPIIHIELLLAVFLCGFFLFKIFRFLKLPFWYASIVAIGLTFLAPQNLRMTSHFGLAQHFVIPLILYLLLKFEAKPSFKTSCWIGFSVFISAILHFYFFGILVFLISFYCLFRALFQSGNGNAFFSKKITKSAQWQYATKMIPHYFFMVGIPLLFFLFWMILPDPVKDRSPNPYGFLIYITNWEGLFLWNGNPLLNWLGDFFSSMGLVKLDGTTFEGKSYIGFIGTCFFFFGIIYFLLTRFKSIGVFFKNDFILASFLASIVLLILSLGLPFIIHPFEVLTDYVGPLKQFRSMGRFAWVFYFAINIIAFKAIFNFFSNKQGLLKLVGLFLVLSILCFESFTFSEQNKLHLSKVDYWTQGQPFTAIESIDFNQYQATIPVPYFNVGSNSFDKDITGFCAQKSFVLSNQTGLPTTGSMLTRSSITQTFNQWQLVLSPYRKPVVFEHFKNDKPLLLVWFNNAKEDYLPRYSHLRKGAKSIFKKGELELFSTELSDFDTRIEAEKNKIKQSILTDTITQIGDFLSTDSIKNYVYKNFDENKSDLAYLSQGSYSGALNQRNIIFEGKLPEIDINSLYHLQMWAWVIKDKMAGSLITVSEENDNGDILQTNQFPIWPNHPQIVTIDPNGWALIDFEFQPKAVDSKIVISFTGAEPRDTRIQYFDEVLIKPKKTDLYQDLPKFYRKNNLWFEK